MKCYHGISLVALLAQVAVQSSASCSSTPEACEAGAKLDDENALLQVHVQQHDGSKSGRDRQIKNLIPNRWERVLMQVTKAETRSNSSEHSKRAEVNSASRSSWPSAAKWSELDSSIGGDVLLPVDPGFSDAVESYIKPLTITPGALVLPTSFDDVISVVKFANDNNVPMSVKAMGAAETGQCVKDGSLVLSVAKIKGMFINTAAMEMLVSPGNTMKEINDLCKENDVYFPGTVNPMIGPVGCMFGCCYGPLSRISGFDISNGALVGALMISEDGGMSTADELGDPDLYEKLKAGSPDAAGIIVSGFVRPTKEP